MKGFVAMDLRASLVSSCITLIFLIGCISSGRGKVVDIPVSSFSNEDQHGCISPCLTLNPIQTVGRTRQKRHTADHLINDNVSRHLKMNGRMQMLFRLLRSAGSSSDGSCKCESPASFDARRQNTPGCKCDVASMVKVLLARLHASGKEIDIKNEKDPLMRYFSRLSDSRKQRIQMALRDEIRRLRGQEILKRLRRRRMLRRMWHRKRALRQNPNAAFRGKQMLSFR